MKNLFWKLLTLLERLGLVCVFAVACYIEWLMAYHHISYMCMLNTCLVTVKFAVPLDLSWLAQ